MTLLQHTAWALYVRGDRTVEETLRFWAMDIIFDIFIQGLPLYRTCDGSMLAAQHLPPSRYVLTFVLSVSGTRSADAQIGPKATATAASHWSSI